MIADSLTRKILITTAVEIKICTMAAVEISPSIRMTKAMHVVTRITTKNLKLKMITTRTPPITRKSHATSIAKTTLNTTRLRIMASTISTTLNTKRTLNVVTLISIVESLTRPSNSSSKITTIINQVNKTDNRSTTSMMIGM